MEYVTMTLTRHRLVSLPEPPSEELLQEEFLYNDDEPTQKLASVVKEEKKKSSCLKLALRIAVAAVIILHDKLDKTIVTTFLFMSLMLALVLVGVMVFAMLLPRLSTRFLSSKWTKNKVVEMVLKVLTAMNATLTRPGTLIAGIIF